MPRRQSIVSSYTGLCMTANEKRKSQRVFTWTPRQDARSLKAKGVKVPDLKNRPTVWILGAGCSRNYSGLKIVQRRYRNLKPPLQNDFFKMARIVIADAKKYIPTHAEDDLPRLLYTLRYLYPGSHWPSSKAFWDHSPEVLLARDSPNLEDLMTMLELYFEAGWTTLGVKVFGESGWSFSPASVSHHNLKEDDQNRFLNLLIATLVTSMGGPTCSFHSRLARLMKSGDTVQL